MNTSSDAHAAIAPDDERSAPACPRCGLTEAELRSDGRMGCPACYDAFAALVEQAITTLHGVRIAAGAPAAGREQSAPSPRPGTPPPAGASSRHAALPWPTRRAAPAPPPQEDCLPPASPRDRRRG